MRALALPLLLCSSLSACLTMDSKPEIRQEPTYESAARNDFLAANYRAADSLSGQFRRHSNGGPLIVATVVSIDALEQSSTLGRLISEQVAARFAQTGYRMVEMKIRNNIYMKHNEGELLLTREINEVARNHSAQAVIVGTYGASGDTVFVNLKVVQPGSNAVLAVHDYALPLNRDVRAMMTRNVNR